MDKKNLAIFSIIANIMFVAMIIYVRHYNAGQAQERIDKLETARNTILSQNAEYFSSNKVLLSLALEIYESDQSLKEITRLAKSKKLPGRSNENALLGFSAEKVQDLKGRSIGWEMSNKNYFSIKVGFDDKDNLSIIDTDRLFWDD